MTDSTASYSQESCNGTYREDLMGLRPLGPCAITSRPNFGMVEVRSQGAVGWEPGSDDEPNWTSHPMVPNVLVGRVRSNGLGLLSESGPVGVACTTGEQKGKKYVMYVMVGWYVRWAARVVTWVG